MGIMREAGLQKPETEKDIINAAASEFQAAEVTTITDSVSDALPRRVDSIDSLLSMACDDYEGACALTKTTHLDFNNMSGCPISKDDVIEMIKHECTPEKVEALQRFFKSPVLQLQPEMPYEEWQDLYPYSLEQAGTTNTIVKPVNFCWPQQAWQQQDMQNGIYRRFMSEIKKWKIVVADRLPLSIKDGDRPELTVGQRAAFFNEQMERNGISGMDFRGFLLMMMHLKKMGTRSPHTIGRQSVILSGQPEFDGCIATGGYRPDNVMMEETTYLNRIETEKILPEGYLYPVMNFGVLERK